MYVTVFNPGDSPVPAGDGRTVGGAEWAPAQSTSDEVKSAIAAGRLIKVDESAVTGESTYEAQAAVEATAEMNKRVEDAKALDKRQAVEAAAAAGIELPPETPVSEVREVLVQSDAVPDDATTSRKRK